MSALPSRRAVSYTHLDVYKRQVLDLPLLFVKDMIVYNTDKIAGYDFSSTPMFFEVRLIQPAE